MMILRLALILIICLNFITTSLGQQEYLIKFKINGLKDTTCMVGNYYGNGTYITDTLKVDKMGHCTLKAPADRPRGLYIFIITDKKYFDFVIDKDHKFTLETDTSDLIGKMVIKDSPDNELFYYYLRTNQSKFDQIKQWQSREKLVGENSDSVEICKKKINELSKELIAFKLEIIREHPSTFTSLLLNIMKEPTIPDSVPVLPNGRKDSTFRYRYYKSHFWEDVDFTDSRLLRTPVYYNKLKKYFDNVLIPVPDTIIREVDIMIEKTRPNLEMFKYMIWFTTFRYETSEIMGFDRVFVHIIDTYYVTGQTSWVDKGTTEKIIKKANKIRNLLIGVKAPNMIMQDTNFRLISMYNINAKYVMLLFWDPECSHCEQEMPVIRTTYETYKEKYGLEIFAVCSDTNMVKMKNKIKKHNMHWINVNGPRTVTGDSHDSYDIISTPVIYILNDRKEIIAKQISAERIGGFLDNYENTHKK